MQTVQNKNFLENDLPDKSMQLIIADPPYYKIKGEFDFIWDSLEDYLKDVEKWAIECKRLLADNGTLFWYGHAKNIAYSQIILDKHFNLVNSLVWEKIECQTLKCRPSDLRMFAPVTERVLMYDNGQDVSGLQRINDDIELFLPIKQYFDDWLDASGLSLKEAVKYIGSTSTHWFGFTKREKVQFMFPTIEKWSKMGEIHGHSKEYESLRQEYESLRRTFNLQTMQTDVLKFSQETHITSKYDHETKKPETLTRLFIITCSKKGDNLFVPFAGSGTECAMGLKEGLNVWGYDISPKHCKTANDRCEIIKANPTLF